MATVAEPTAVKSPPESINRDESCVKLVAAEEAIGQLQQTLLGLQTRVGNLRARIERGSYWEELRVKS